MLLLNNNIAAQEKVQRLATKTSTHKSATMKNKTIIMTVAIAAAIALTTLTMATVTEAIPGEGMDMTVDAMSGSDTIMVSGMVVTLEPTDVAITTASPSGLNVASKTITPVNGMFDTSLTIDHTWSENGTYTITTSSGANMSEYRISIPIEVDGGLVAFDIYMMDDTGGPLDMDMMPSPTSTLTYDEIEKKWTFWKYKSADQKAEIKDLKKEIKQLQNENKKLDRTLEKVRNIKESKKVEIESLNLEIQNLKAAIDTMKTQMTEAGLTIPESVQNQHQ